MKIKTINMKKIILVTMFILEFFSLKAQTDCVYVAGFTRSTDGRQYAAYWKSGQLTKLTDGSTRDEARSVAVIGNDVHVVGFKMKGNNRVAAYWKNGQEVPLNLEGYYSPNSGNEAYAVKGVGSDVYIFVSQPSRRSTDDPYYFYYYKNGKAVKILISEDELRAQFGGTVRGRLSEHYFVSESGDVYEAGAVQGNGNSVGYWKNGHFIAERASEKYPYGKNVNINSIFVSNNGDVYIAGSTCYTNDHKSDFAKAVYWKNGKEIVLPVEKGAAQATSINVQGNDVFVSGYQTKTFSHFSAVYWKNGQKITLAEDENTGNDAVTKSIAVVDGNVYAAGSHKGNLYWKNGKEIKLNEESGGEVFSMMVVKGGGCVNNSQNSNFKTTEDKQTLRDKDLAYVSLAAGAVTAMSLIKDRYVHKGFSGKFQTGIGYEQTPMITNQNNPYAAAVSYEDKASYPLVHFGLNLEFANNKAINLNVRPLVSIGIDAFTTGMTGTHVVTGVDGGLRFWYKSHTKFKLFADLGWYERVGDKTADEESGGTVTTDEVREGKYRYHVLRYGAGPMLHLRHDGRETWIKPGVYFEKLTFAKDDNPTMSYALSVNIQSKIILEASYSKNYPVAGTASYPFAYVPTEQDYFSIKIIKQGKL